MKKLIRVVCMVLTLSLVASVAAQSVDAVEPRESAFFSSHSVSLHKTSSTSLKVCFDVVSNALIMDEIGASMIEIYRSSNGVNWSKIKTYYKSNTSSMICTNTTSHSSNVTYTTALSGYYYMAGVTLYAKNSTGIGEKLRYTNIVYM